MKLKKNRESLSDEQKTGLKRLHSTELMLEISLAVLIVSLVTANISSALPLYGIIVAFTVLVSGLMIFICGIVLTTVIFGFKILPEPFPTLMRTPRNWAIATWISLLAIVLLLIFWIAFIKDPALAGLGVVLFILAVAAAFVSCICTVVTANLLWRRFNKKSGISPRFFVYGSLGVVLLLTALLGSYTTTETIEFKKISSSDSGLELGQSEVRQVGRDGKKETKRNLFFGYEVSSSQTDPVDEITAVGTRKYQYMHCSDGSYRYYTSEQFKDPNTGFTHQSPDYCAKNGNGTQIAISDTPPAQKIIQQVPTYRSPSYHSTTCRPSYFGDTFTCSGWY